MSYMMKPTTFVNCQLKYILINDNLYSGIGMNSIITTNGAELIWVYDEILLSFSSAH